VSDRRTEGDVLNNLGMLELRTGDLELGRRWAGESAAVYGGIRFSEGQLDALGTLAAIEAAAGRAFEALQMLTVVERERRQLGGAALSVERAELGDAALAAATAALSAERRAEAVASARLIGLADLVAANP
jgi:hypothetical protein